MEIEAPLHNILCNVWLWSPTFGLSRARELKKSRRQMSSRELTSCDAPSAKNIASKMGNKVSFHRRTSSAMYIYECVLVVLYFLLCTTEQRMPSLGVCLLDN